MAIKRAFEKISALIIYAHIIYCNIMTWEFEHTIATSARKKELWALYSNIESWPLWDHGIENISLDEEFREGAKGKIKPEGQDLLNYMITWAEPEKGFSDETFIDGFGATVKFIHTFSDLPDGKVCLTHHITISCPGKEEVEEKIGEGTSSGVPRTMESLTRMAIFLEKICKFN